VGTLADAGAVVTTSPSWGSYSYGFGPLVALGVVGALVLVLRWAFSGGGSLVERRSRQGREDEYGLLVAIAAPATFVEGEVLRRTLEDAGLRATLATTTEGPRLMVFRRDEPAARRLLATRS
jgi:hypothetical protein